MTELQLQPILIELGDNPLMIELGDNPLMIELAIAPSTVPLLAIDFGLPGPPGSPDTGAEILAKLLPVDGTRSELDADLLDGNHAAAFALTNDARLSDARTPTSHDHANNKLAQANTHESADTDSATTSLHHTLGTGANQACAGNDTRLSDARTPTAHSHAGIYQPADDDLTALAALTDTGAWAKRTGDGVWIISTPTAADVGADATGAAASAVSAHESASDPHSQYETQSRADARYSTLSHTHTATDVGAQSADADLTAIAALTATGGYAKRTAADTWTIATPSAADVGAYTSGTVDTLLSGKQPADADLTALAALTDTGAWAKRTGNGVWIISMPTAADVGAVPVTRQVNAKALSADISLTAADVGAAAVSTLPYPSYGNGIDVYFPMYSPSSPVVSADTLFATFLPINETITINQIGVYCSLLQSGAKARLGIYQAAAKPALYPATLLLDAGEVNLTSTGIKTITINQVLTPGNYFLAYVNNNSSVRIYASAALSPIYQSSSWSFYGSSSYGALPSNFPTIVLTSFTMGVFVRRSA